MNKLSLGLALALAGSVFASAAMAQAASAAAAATPVAATGPKAAADAKAAAASTGDAMAGTAAWYGSRFNGRKTASGQRFDAAALTAAHPTLPFGSRVKVTNTGNKRSVVVVVNDRGPSTPGRVLDVTQAAAQRLGFVRSGTADVTLDLVGKTAMKHAGRKPTRKASV